MKPEDVLTLAKAGFTATQISAIMSTLTTSVPAPTPAPAPVTAQATNLFTNATATAPVTAQAPNTFAPAPTPTTTPAPNLDPIMEQINRLTGIVQSQAIINSQLPTPETVDDILAKVINPPSKEVK